MNDPKLQAIAEAAAALQRALNDYGRYLSVEVRVTEVSMLSREEARSLYDVLIHREERTRIHP